MRSILIFDNSHDFLETTSTMLRKENFATSTCNSLHSMFEKLNSIKPDVLIIDITHTPLEDKEACDYIRTRSGQEQLPILLTSIHARHIAQYKLYGANDVIQKPFSQRELVTKMKTLLRSKQMT